MTTYEPGTVAVATVRGVKDVRVWKMASGTSWATDRVVHGPPGSWRDIVGDEVVTDIRPLVVLDPSVDIPPAFTIDWLRSAADIVAKAHEYDSACSEMLRSLANQIEAQTKPPRIPEPGLWGVVEAKRKASDTFTGKYVRKYDKGNGGYDWQALNFMEGSLAIRWSELIDPTLIREGLTS